MGNSATPTTSTSSVAVSSTVPSASISSANRVSFAANPEYCSAPVAQHQSLSLDSVDDPDEASSMQGDTVGDEEVDIMADRTV